MTHNEAAQILPDDAAFDEGGEIVPAVEFDYDAIHADSQSASIPPQFTEGDVELILVNGISLIVANRRAAITRAAALGFMIRGYRSIAEAARAAKVHPSTMSK